MREDCLGVTSEGLWASTSTHESIRLTPRGEVRLVSRERSQVVETEPPTEPSQEEGETLVLPPGPNTVTLEERACLSEVALSSAPEAPEPHETCGLQEIESAACVVASTMVFLSEVADESETAMDLSLNQWKHQGGRAVHKRHI